MELYNKILEHFKEFFAEKLKSVITEEDLRDIIDEFDEQWWKVETDFITDSKEWIAMLLAIYDSHDNIDICFLHPADIIDYIEHYVLYMLKVDLIGEDLADKLDIDAIDFVYKDV